MSRRDQAHGRKKGLHQFSLAELQATLAEDESLLHRLGKSLPDGGEKIRKRIQEIESMIHSRTTTGLESQIESLALGPSGSSASAPANPFLSNPTRPRGRQAFLDDFVTSSSPIPTAPLKASRPEATPTAATGSSSDEARDSGTSPMEFLRERGPRTKFGLSAVHPRPIQQIPLQQAIAMSKSEAGRMEPDYEEDRGGPLKDKGTSGPVKKGNEFSEKRGREHVKVIDTTTYRQPVDEDLHDDDEDEVGEEEVADYWENHSDDEEGAEVTHAPGGQPFLIRS